MKKNYILSVVSILFLLFFQNAFSKNPPIPLGGWRTHTPYSKAIDLAFDNSGHIYCATKLGMFRYDKSSGETDLYTRLSGLSDYEISTIKYDTQTGILLIAYLNSNVDLLYPDGSIVNLPDIKDKSIIGGKKINSITFVNRTAYLSCEFGIVVINLTRQEVSDTWYITPTGINPNINAMAYDPSTDVLIAATDTGLYASTYSDPNVFNYSGWSKMTNLATPNGIFSNVVVVDGVFFTVKTKSGANDSLFYLQNNTWQLFNNIATSGITISSYRNLLNFTLFYTTQVFDKTGQYIGAIDGSLINDADMRRGMMDDQGTIWVADFNNGLLKQEGSGVRTIVPNGPASDAVYSMSSGKGNVWIASGALDGTSPNYSVKDGIYYFSDNTWKTFNCNNDSIYRILCNGGSKTVMYVAVDPDDPQHAYIGSYGNGLLEYTANGGVARYTSANSTIVSHNSIPNYFLVGGIAFDNDGVLWGVCSANRNGIFAREKDGTWHQFIISDVSVSTFGLYKLIVDDNGQKWFIAREGASTGSGVCVFKENNLSSPTLAGFKRFIDRSGYGNLPSLFVNDMAKDKDGAIWLGTDKGVAVIYNPGNALTGNADAQQVVIVQDGYAQYLLESERVTAVAVDGANRKWFGTYSSGAYLLNPDGTKQLLKFDISNSPLPSDNIISITIDDLTGEVFVATEKGIVSYRGDATEGGEKCEDYTVYPNPVRSEYNGPIAISGLVNNADVRIADIAGNVVYHTKANGGLAVWNGNNFDGKRAQTGIYVVYVTNEDGSASCITKLLFAR